ncbi:hypothetical protein M0802_015447 [Mischocyttarus mexicanus]|nr:hypothetical protein M0802_015447 [Mischocyttarus mexicanus]
MGGWVVGGRRVGGSVGWVCASHEGGFARVSPRGFIEAHIAWYGVPASSPPTQGMYQNAAADPQEQRGVHWYGIALVRKL